MVDVQKELKREILNWLLENENQWQRVNACKDKFRNYIFDDCGEFLIGGRDVSGFIKSSDKLIYG